MLFQNVISKTTLKKIHNFCSNLVSHWRKGRIRIIRGSGSVPKCMRVLFKLSSRLFRNIRLPSWSPTCTRPTRWRPTASSAGSVPRNSTPRRTSRFTPGRHYKQLTYSTSLQIFHSYSWFVAILFGIKQRIIHVQQRTSKDNMWR